MSFAYIVSSSDDNGEIEIQAVFSSKKKAIRMIITEIQKIRKYNDREINDIENILKIYNTIDNYPIEWTIEKFELNYHGTGQGQY